MEQYYFAYGSNINLQQMALRCPNAKVVGPCVLENYELLFRGNGGGFGVATIAAKAGSRVHGLLWKITPRDEQRLDVYEGYPHLYAKQTVTVKAVSGEKVAVMAYVMTRETECRPTVPSASYYFGIMEGFQQNGLPQEELKKALRQCWQEVDALVPQKPQKKKKGRDTHER